MSQAIAETGSLANAKKYKNVYFYRKYVKTVETNNLPIKFICFKY